MVAARGLDDDVRLNRGDRPGVVPLEDRVGSHGTGYLQRPLVHVHGHDPAGAGAFEDGDGQGPDGAAADHQRRLSRHVPGARHGVPGDAGRFRQGRGPQLQPRRQRPEHPGRQRST